MSFPVEIYNRARELKKEQKDSAELALNDREAVLEQRFPEYRELRLRQKSSCWELARLILGEDGDIDEIRRQNLRAQSETNAMLRAAGLPLDYLTAQYSCPDCEDTGYIKGKVCGCLVELMKKLCYEDLNSKTPLSLCSFESFSLANYPDEADNAKGISPRRIMERNFDRCKKYAEFFSTSSPSLLFQGGVGLGKTHLSLAIAGELINKGYSVLYGSASDFFERIEREHFNRSITTDTRYLLESCDLLIIDDLGAEFTTSFTTSTLLNLVNARLLSKKPTIISTNLTIGGLENKYSERLISRLYGSYNRLQFVGKDIRISLRKARNGENTINQE